MTVYLAYMASTDGLTADILAKLAESKIDLTDEERGQLADASRAYHTECLTWYTREGGDWVLYGIANWPESYYWDEFPDSVWSRCDEDLRAALQERVESYKYALVARWLASRPRKTRSAAPLTAGSRSELSPRTRPAALPSAAGVRRPPFSEARRRRFGLPPTSRAGIAS